MENRYQRLFIAAADQIAAGCPAALSAGAITRDAQTGRVFAQLRVRNLAEKPLKGAKVTLQPFDTVGQPLGEAVTFDYLDLRIRRGEEFGQKTPVWLPDEASRGFAVTDVTLYYEDNSTRKCTQLTWEPLPEQRKLTARLSEAQAAAYRKRFGNDHTFLPDQHGGVWRCACGAVNAAGLSCCRCRRTYEAVSAIDPDALTIEAARGYLDADAVEEAQALLRPLAGNDDADALLIKCDEALAERRAREEAQRAEAERLAEEKQAKRKALGKKLRIGGVCAGIAAVLAAGALVFAFVGMPAIRYSGAQKLLAAEDYSGAYDAYTALGDYKDASAMALETRYREAAALAAKEDFAGAAEIFTALGAYKDSAALARKYGVEARYDKGLKALEAKDYETAITELEGVGDGVKDAPAKAKEAHYLYAVDLLNKKSYDGAIAHFEKAGDYEDAAKQANEAKKAYGLALFGKNDFVNAYTYLSALKDDKDEAGKAAEAAYKQGISLVKSKSWLDAIDWLKTAGGFSDSKKQIFEAELQYVKANQNNANEKVKGFVTELKKNGYSLITAQDVSDVTGGSQDKKHLHLFTAGDVVAATCSAGGYTNYACTCGAKAKGGKTDKLEHNFTGGDCKHHPKCSNCGAESDGYGEHSWGEWHASAGEESRECSICGDAQARPHTYSGYEIISDAHYPVCSVCGYVNGRGGSRHTFDSSGRCTVCGYQSCVHLYDQNGYCVYCGAPSQMMA